MKSFNYLCKIKQPENFFQCTYKVSHWNITFFSYVSFFLFLFHILYPVVVQGYILSSLEPEVVIYEKFYDSAEEREDLGYFLLQPTEILAKKKNLFG